MRYFMPGTIVVIVLEVDNNNNNNKYSIFPK